MSGVGTLLCGNADYQASLFFLKDPPRSQVLVTILSKSQVLVAIILNCKGLNTADP